MKKIILASFSILLLFTTSCKNENEKINSNNNDTVDSAMINLETVSGPINYEGLYKGVFPCSEKDCKNMEIEIKLLPNQGYIYSTKRIGIDNEFLRTTGIFEFHKDSVTFVLPEIADAPNTYSIEKGRIIRFDKDGRKIETADSTKFILIKQ